MAFPAWPQRAMLILAVCMGVAALLARCAPEPSPQQVELHNEYKAHCDVQRFSGRTDTMQTVEGQMKVRNLGKWCADVLVLDHGAATGWAIDRKPKHGEAAVENTKDGKRTAVGYLPAHSYSGSDEMTVTLKSPSLTVAIHYDITVTAP
jgi:hypothetical protein